MWVTLCNFMHIALHANQTLEYDIEYLTVDAPIAKATKSVMDVTVIETPACCMAIAIFTLRSFLLCRAVRLFQASIMTNISSTPRPAKQKIYQNNRGECITSNYNNTISMS